MRRSSPTISGVSLRGFEREKVVWRLFVGSQPSPEQNKLYAQFRAMLLKGTSLKTNA